MGLGLAAGPTPASRSQTGGPWHATAWAVERGLPHNGVECLLRTRDGFLWIGTREGLARFDGFRFTVFDGSTPGFTDDACMDLAEDSRGGLWIATKRGAYRYVSGGFAKFTTQDGLPGDSVRMLHALPAGGMGLATSGGLSIHDDSLFRSFPFTVTNVEGDFHRVVTHGAECLLDTPDGRLWVGGPEGLSALDPASGVRTLLWPRTLTSENSARAAVRALVQDRDGTLWFGTDHALMHFRGGVFEEYPFPPAYGDIRLRRIRAHAPGELWIVRAGLLLRFRTDAPKFEPFEGVPGLGNQFVTDLLSGSDDLLWIGTRFGGLLQVRRLRARTLTVAEGLPHHAVRSVATAREGGVWVATAGGVAHVRDDKAVPLVFEGPRTARGTSLALEDSEGRIWLTDEQASGGAYERVGDRYRLLGGSTPCGGATAAHADAAGRIWFGSSDGFVSAVTDSGRQADLSGFDPDTATQGIEWWEYRTSRVGFHRGSGSLEVRDGEWTYRGSFVRRGPYPEPGPPTPLVLASPVAWGAPFVRGDVRCFAEEPDGTLWMGTADRSLLRLRDRRLEVATTIRTNSRTAIACLHRDADGALWIGSGDGLDLVRDGRQDHFSEADGLPDASIQQIQSDAQDHLWLATGRGLFRVARADLLRRAADPAGVPRVEGLLVDESDGLLTGDLGATSQPGSCRTSDGRLWFATPRGLVVVSPESVHRDDRPPPVSVTEVRTAAGRVVPRGGEFRLPPGSGRHLELDYTALAFVAPEKVRFRYRLKGHDDRWIDAETRRVAYFTNLRPGAYRFEVTACHRDGVWSVTPAVARFVIGPRLYERPAFGVGLAIVGIAGIGAFYRARLRSIRRKERHAIARALHDELAGKLAALVKTAERDSGASAEAIASPTVDLARSALKTLRRTIALGLPASERLPALVQAIVQNAEETCLPLRLALRLDVPIDVPDRPVTPRVREEVLLIASEALNNVIKHADASRVTLRMGFVPGLLRLEIEDDGHGIRDATSASVVAVDDDHVGHAGGGLHSMRERAAAIRASLTVAPVATGGTLVRLVVPRP